MGNIFKRASGAAGSISDWAGAVTAGTIVFGWLSTRVPAFGAVNWAEAIFLGLATVLLIITVLSMGALGWRAFRPLPTGKHSLPSLMADAEVGVEPIKPHLDPRAINVSRINIDPSHLEDEHVLQIVLCVFNGTNIPFDFKSISGRIQASSYIDGATTEIGTLPPASIVRENMISGPIAPFTEATLVLEQPVRPAIIASVSAAINLGAAHFHLDKIDIMISSSGSAADKVRLPLWDGAALTRRQIMPFTGKISFLHATSVVTATTSV